METQNVPLKTEENKKSESSSSNSSYDSYDSEDPSSDPASNETIKTNDKPKVTTGSSKPAQDSEKNMEDSEETDKTESSSSGTSIFVTKDVPKDKEKECEEYLQKHSEKHNHHTVNKVHNERDDGWGRRHSNNAHHNDGRHSHGHHQPHHGHCGHTHRHSGHSHRHSAYSHGGPNGYRGYSHGRGGHNGYRGYSHGHSGGYYSHAHHGGYPDGSHRHSGQHSRSHDRRCSEDNIVHAHAAAPTHHNNQESLTEFLPRGGVLEKTHDKLLANSILTSMHSAAGSPNHGTDRVPHQRHGSYGSHHHPRYGMNVHNTAPPPHDAYPENGKWGPQRNSREAGTSAVFFDPGASHHHHHHAQDQGHLTTTDPGVNTTTTTYPPGPYNDTHNSPIVTLNITNNTLAPPAPPPMSPRYYSPCPSVSEKELDQGGPPSRIQDATSQIFEPAPRVDFPIEEEECEEEEVVECVKPKKRKRKKCCKGSSDEKLKDFLRFMMLQKFLSWACCQCEPPPPQPVPQQQTLMCIPFPSCSPASQGCLSSGGFCWPSYWSTGEQQCCPPTHTEIVYDLEDYDVPDHYEEDSKGRAEPKYFRSKEEQGGGYGGNTSVESYYHEDVVNSNVEDSNSVERKCRDIKSFRGVTDCLRLICCSLNALNQIPCDLFAQCNQSSESETTSCESEEDETESEFSSSSISEAETSESESEDE